VKEIPGVDDDRPFVEPACADLADECARLTRELAALTASEQKYRRAAEALARQCATARLDAERERAALLDDRDAFVLELTLEHDRLIETLARERDQAQALALDAVSVRDGVTEASKRLARERTRARIELGETTLARDIALRDAARAQRQLDEARDEIARLRIELARGPRVSEAPAQTRPSRIPMPPGKTRSSSPPPPSERPHCLDLDDDPLAHALVMADPPSNLW
jgi:hypothetical protein